MAKLLGIDVGTSGTKAVLINESGVVLKSANVEYPLSTPQPLWAEQDPHDWTAAAESVISQIGESQPDAIGLTGQMHGLVALDQMDKVLAPAILWCDQRTSKQCAQIDSVLGESSVRQTTGNAPMTGFQAPKILWLRDNRPADFSRMRSALLPKDYVRLALTGEKATDVSDASGTGLFNLKIRNWWKEGVQELGLDTALFPRAHESTEICAQTNGYDGLAKGIPVVAGAGDQAAAAVSTGATEQGLVSVSMGTSGVVFAPLATPTHDPDGSANVFCHANGAWHVMGVMLSCGGAVKWLRETLYPGATYAEIDSDAAKIPPGAEGLSFLPYLSGERCPHNDPTATASFAGLTLTHSRAHIARAVLEGATFGLGGCMKRLISLGISPAQVRVTGGGAASDLWMQMLADVLRLPCERVSSDSGPAVGAAVLAGVGVGVWPDLRAAAGATSTKGRVFEPSSTDYVDAVARFDRMYPALKVWKS
ncbi:MAG TPA: xylulokinase [Fimbriimonadaceae bacterium]|nr:xylulokinase [Fimbriimonadaceae bacterium]